MGPDPYNSEKMDPDPHCSDADPHPWMRLVIVGQGDSYDYCTVCMTACTKNTPVLNLLRFLILITVGVSVAVCGREHRDADVPGSVQAHS